MWEFWRSRLSKGKTRHRRRAGSDDDGSLSPMTSRSNLIDSSHPSVLPGVRPIPKSSVSIVAITEPLHSSFMVIRGISGAAVTFLPTAVFALQCKRTLREYPCKPHFCLRMSQYTWSPAQSGCNRTRPHHHTVTRAVDGEVILQVPGRFFGGTTA